ncbi:MAG: M24 family metallopeptidase [Bdellovibrionota bacterium]
MKFEKSKIVKDQLEIACIREASLISSDFHTLGMSRRIIGKSENELLSFYNTYKKHFKFSTWAYPVVIGSGERSTILHARPTKKNLYDGDLVLVDLGVKYNGYCSDVTRTWPVGERFSKEQKTIYQIVLSAQKAAIKRACPGSTLDEIHEYCRKSLLEGLLSKGIIKSGKIDKYFPHKTSHWIGRDVHDECPHQYIDKSPIILSPGMCFTIEPGLYFKGTCSKYEGIGVRIEDVILVTDEGNEVLSRAPKEIEEVECLRSLAV